MSKLENASGNLKEILCAIAEGKAVQFNMDNYWSDFVEGHTPPYGETMLKQEWRIKPDAFEEIYNKFVQERFPAVYEINKDQARHFWDRAMEQDQ